MWKSLISLGRDVFNLNHRVEGQKRQIGELVDSVRDLSTDNYRLSERILRLELEVQHTKEAHARDFIQLKEAHARDFTQLKEEHLREREHWQARLSADRENFRLQIENLVLRMQRGLPLPELPQKPEDE